MFVHYSLLYILYFALSHGILYALAMYIPLMITKNKKTTDAIQGGPKVGIQLLKVGFGSKSRFVVLM